MLTFAEPGTGPIPCDTEQLVLDTNHFLSHHEMYPNVPQPTGIEL